MASRVRHEPASIEAVIAELEEVGVKTTVDQARLRRAINMLGELRAAHRLNPEKRTARGTALDRPAASETDALEQMFDQVAAAFDHWGEDRYKQYLTRAMGIMRQLHDQASAGVHKNPALIVFGNPKRQGAVISHNVQGVLYLRDDDGIPYVHGFGDAPITLRSSKSGSVTIGKMKNETGVEAVLLTDGSILLRGPLR